MRMWMVNPSLMCRKHLLGEHVELHMLVGSLKRGKSIKGFLEKQLLEPQNIRSRHDSLVDEMKKRGYNHKSPLEQPNIFPAGFVDELDSAKELTRRCSACRERADLNT